MHKGNYKMDAGAFYAPYIPLQGLVNEYKLVEKFNGIHVIEECIIHSLWDIKCEPSVLYRVHSTSGKTSFLYPVDDKHCYKKVTDEEESMYVADEVPYFKFIQHIEDIVPFLNCTEEEYLMFVLKYGQDFDQG